MNFSVISLNDSRFNKPFSFGKSDLEVIFLSNNQESINVNYGGILCPPNNRKKNSYSYQINIIKSTLIVITIIILQ